MVPAWLCILRCLCSTGPRRWCQVVNISVRTNVKVRHDVLVKLDSYPHPATVDRDSA